MTGIELEAALTAFPRSRLCDFATPVHRLPRLERKLNTCPLYIKRDDLNGVGSGGNKVRPLEYLLGEAQAQGCDVVIASGQENSNLCSIAASACCRLGLKCILVHNNDQPTRLAGNILLNKLSGVEEHYVGPIPETERNDYVAALAERLRQEGKKPFVVENVSVVSPDVSAFFPQLARLSIIVPASRAARSFLRFNMFFSSKSDFYFRGLCRID